MTKEETCKKVISKLVNGVVDGQDPPGIAEMLAEMVTNGVLEYGRNEEGEPSFVMTEPGKRAVEDWMLGNGDDAD